MNKELFNKYNLLYLDGLTESEQNINNDELVYILLEFIKQGYILNIDLVNTILKKDKSEVITFLKKVYNDLFGMEFTEYSVFYKNFAIKTDSLSDIELYTNALIHYLSLGEIFVDSEDLFENKVLVGQQDIKLDNCIKIDVCTKEKLLEIATNILSSNIMLPEADLNLAKEIILSLNKNEVEKLLYNTEITMKETLISITELLLKNNITVLPNFKTATDVLRFISSLSKQKFNNKFIEFKYFNRTELNYIISLLEKINCTDDFKLYRKPWKKFFSLYANKINWNKYPGTKRSVDILFGKIKYQTKRGKIQSGYLDLIKNYTDDKDTFVKIEKLVSDLKDRPGDFARQLVSVLSEIKPVFTKYVVGQFINVIDSVDSRVLYQLKDRLENLENDRFVVIKNVIYVYEEAKYLENNEINYLLDRINFVLESRISKLDSLGAVYIDEELKNINITTSLRGVGQGKNQLTLGSKVYFNESSEVIRLFTAWKGLYVDIDLNLDCLDEDLNSKNHITYYKLRSNDKYLKHSGDITSAPNGAVEFIDITNLPELKKKYKYLVGTISSFSGETFDELNTVYSGIMELTEDESKKADFYTTAVKVGFQNKSQSQSCINFIIDLENNCFIFVDKSLTGKYSCRNLSNDHKYIKSVVKALNNRKYTTVYDMLYQHAQLRGFIVDDKESADTVFEKDTLILNQFLSNFLQ